MREQVVAILNAFNVTDAGIDPFLDLTITNVSWEIRNLTNLPEIPEGLKMAVAYKVAGTYLSVRKNAGKLNEEGFDFEETIKQIQEGDTNITFTIGDGDLTPEQRFDNLVHWMMSCCDDQIYRYRRLVW